MKKLIALLFACACASSALAQTTATVGSVDFEAERARLTRERDEVENRFKSEQAACYKKFAVEGCLKEGRVRRRLANEDIKRQEAVLNDIERKRSGAAELDKLHEKKSESASTDANAKREESLKSQDDRERRAAEHATSRSQAEAEAAERQRQFKDKQQANAEHQAKQAERRADMAASRAEYEQKLRDAREHQEELERRNSARTKPRAAPLPEAP